ncbi:MAG: hypothetical protein ACOC41_06685 [Chitinivibrionales bacterium]
MLQSGSMIGVFTNNQDAVFSGSILELPSLPMAQERVYEDIASFSAVIDRKPDHEDYSAEMIARQRRSYPFLSSCRNSFLHETGMSIA